MRKILLTLAATLLAGFAFAQSVQVSGIVVDENNEPMFGVNVYDSSTLKGAVTDLNGAYSISVPSNATLAFTFTGYKEQNIAVSGKKIINVTMEPIDEMIDEIVITAYGVSTKGTFTGSAVAFDAKEIEARQVSNITNALSGAMAGVQTQSSNGQPGTSSKILIRGVGSINAGTSPLIVLDGVPFDGDLSSINTSDIENLTVLKDAASTALYGARGANGIIMITTKSGRNSKAVVNVDARYGINSRGIKNYDVFSDPVEYMKNVYTGYYNYFTLDRGYAPDAANTSANNNMFSGVGYRVFTTPSGKMFDVDGNLLDDVTLGYKDADFYYLPDNWSDEMFSNNARQEYNVSVTGGTDALTYFLSYGYLDDQGVISGSGFDRNSIRANMEYKANKWLKVGSNMAYTYSESRYPGEQTTTNSSGNAFFLANSISPIYPMYVRGASDEQIMRDPVTGNMIYDYGEGVSTNQKRKFMQIANPAGDLAYNKTEYLMDIFHGNWYAELAPISGLTLTARYGLDIDNTRYNDLGNAYYGQFANYGGTASQAADRTYGFDQQYVANYNTVIDDIHALDFTAGYDSYSLKTNSVQAYGVCLFNPESYYVNNSINQKMGYGSGSEYATEGYFARANYAYDEKYIASLSFRRDASSRFAKENRWGNFYSASAAWVISNEDFLKDADWVDLLKFKASYGEQGNDALGNNYPYMDQYSVTGANSVFSTNLSYKGNKDITWETSVSYNAGFDFSFFKGKLNGTIEYFGRTSKDMLYYKPVNPSLGYTEFPMNIGSLSNKGVELDLNYLAYNTKNLQWNINLNATSIKNKIIELHPDLEGCLIDGTRIYEEGESMYRLYLVKYAGVDPTNGESLFWAKDVDGVEYKTADWTEAGETNKQATKDLMPKVYGGFGTTLNAYGFDFSIQCAYQLGGQIRDYGYQLLMHNGGSSDLGRNWSTDIRNAWTPENTNTDVPRIDYNDKYGNATSDRWLTSSNYLSINNVTFGYTVPANITKKALISKLRFYFAADNLALLSARNGLDPRQGFTSATTSTYTAIKTVSGGVNITF